MLATHSAMLASQSCQNYKDSLITFDDPTESGSQPIESTEASKNSRAEECVALDSNNNNNYNNSGVDFNQQYQEWKEMMVAATAARDGAEQQKQVRNMHMTLFCGLYTFHQHMYLYDPTFIERKLCQL